MSSKLLSLWLLVALTGCAAALSPIAAPPLSGPESRPRRPQAEVEPEAEAEPPAADQDEEDSRRITVRFIAKPCPADDPSAERSELDLNHDGRTDVIEVRRDGVVYCRQADLNFDGRFELVRFLDAQGLNLREEMDLDFDDRLDLVTVFRDGAQLASISDTDHDGRGDLYRCYRERRPVEQLQDLNGDGRVDRWEWYDSGQQMIGSSLDEDGDGRPDEPAPRGLDTSGCPRPRF